MQISVIHSMFSVYCIHLSFNLTAPTPMRHLGLSEILFQRANVANLPNLPNWLCVQILNMSNVWKVQMVEHLWFCISSMLEHK